MNNKLTQRVPGTPARDEESACLRALRLFLSANERGTERQSGDSGTGADG